MPSPIRISCIITGDSPKPSVRILAVGGVGPGGARWELPVPDAVAGVEDGSYRFFVDANGAAVEVVVATDPDSGAKYLKTAADAAHPEGLLSLPRCR